jgi:hypothetical protein
MAVGPGCLGAGGTVGWRLLEFVGRWLADDGAG